MGKVNRPDTLLSELTALKRRVAQLETQQRLSAARISSGQLNVGAIGAAGQIEIDATDEEIRIYNAGVLIAALTAVDGLYLSGYEDFEDPNGITLQPKATPTSDFSPAQIFTRTFTDTGENDTVITSAYDRNVGATAAAIFLRGADAQGGDLSQIILDTEQLWVGPGGGDLLGPWQSYTPAWTASTTNPTLGNGSLTGQYMLVGKTCHVQLGLSIGSTTTIGSGTYQFSVPFTAAAGGTTVQYIGMARLAVGTVRWLGQMVLGAGAAVANVSFPTNTTTTTASNMTAAAPVTPASGNVLTMSLTYQTA
jgi:hypothetical protein